MWITRVLEYHIIISYHPFLSFFSFTSMLNEIRARTLVLVLRTKGLLAQRALHTFHWDIAHGKAQKKRMSAGGSCTQVLWWNGCIFMAGSLLSENCYCVISRLICPRSDVTICAGKENKENMLWLGVLANARRTKKTWGAAAYHCHMPCASWCWREI